MIYMIRFVTIIIVFYNLSHPLFSSGGGGDNMM
jgi:hypothetical protein